MSPAATTPLPTTPHEQTYTCADPDYGFSVSIPAEWQIVQLAPCEARFLAPGGPELEPAALLHGTVAEERFVVGVGVRGPLGAGDGVIDEAGWRSMLPNHTAERAVELVTTPAGQGRVFSLERDREPEDRQEGATAWWAQHALIPAGSVTFELWAQARPEDVGQPVPTLAAMLALFTRTTAGPVSVLTGEGEAIVDFADFSLLIPNAGTSAGGAMLLAQLDKTVFQFAEVESVTYQVGAATPPATQAQGRTATAQVGPGAAPRRPVFHA